MRQKIATKSSFVGITSKLITMVISFVVARLFYDYLGEEIRGISSVFSNVLSLVSLAEAGFGTAIIYALYEPLSKNETGEIKALMRLYKIIYRWIGLIVMVVGTCLIPTIPFFVKDVSCSFGYLVLIYMLQLTASGSTYFIAYKRNLMYADQKQYVAVIIDTLVQILCFGLRVIAMVVYRNYILYLFIQIFQNVFSNVIVHFWCNKQYPYLKEPVTEHYSKTDRLKQDVKNLTIGRVAGTIYSSTDNLIISNFLGVVSVALYTNYLIIAGVFKGLVDSMMESMRPILGNYLVATDDKDRVYDVFSAYTFIRFMIANVCTVGFVTLASPVIVIWLGERFVETQLLVIFMAVDLFIHITHAALTDFIAALGLFKNDRNMTIIGAVLNLTGSIILVPLLGIPGVLLGTVISQVYYWIARGVIVFGNYFKAHVGHYIITIFRYIVTVTIEIVGITYLFKTPFLAKGGIMMLILKIVICGIICVATGLLTNVGTKACKQTFELIKNTIFTRFSGEKKNDAAA